MTHAMVLTALTEEVKKLTCPSHGLLPSKSSIETSENGRQTMANFVIGYCCVYDFNILPRLFLSNCKHYYCLIR